MAFILMFCLGSSFTTAAAQKSLGMKTWTSQIPLVDVAVSEEDRAVTELIFLLDVSKSMEKADREGDIPDFIRQIDLSLPRNYRTGFVSYNAGTVESQALALSGGVAGSLGRVEYSGYSNVGAGLAEALGMFTRGNNGIKRILLVTDGETDMPTEPETAAAGEGFRQAMADAQSQGVIVDILMLEDLSPSRNAGTDSVIEQDAGAYGGKIHLQKEGAAGLPSFAVAYLFQECQVPSVMVGRISGQEAELPVVLPDKFMDTAKILIFGPQPEAQVNVSGKADQMRVEQGEGFTAVILDGPLQEDYTLQVSAQPGMEATAYLTAEYTVSLTAGSRYQTQDGTAYFDLDILGGRGGSLLEGHLAGQDITVLLDGGQQQAGHADGKIQVAKEMAESGRVQISAVLPGTYAYYEGSLETVADVDVPPPVEEPQPDYFPLAVTAILAVTLIILLVWAMKKRRRYPSRRFRDHYGGASQPETQDAYGSEFQGKVTVYIINSGDGTDYQPETLNLADKCPKATATLQWVLDSCGLPLVLRDADRIIFRPGEGRSLLVKNSSRATALKGRDVLAKFHSYPIHFKQKITFLFDRDQEAGEEPVEIEVHYKDLKINER